MKDRLVFTLNEEQWEDFIYHMTHPKEPTPAMKEAARKMAEWARRPGDREYDSWGRAFLDIQERIP